MKKIIFTAVTIASLVFGMLGVSAEDNAKQWYVGAFGGLNCRQQPNTSSDILTTYPRGTELKIIGVNETGDWWETWDGTTQGWCYSTYLTDNLDAVNTDGEIGDCLGTFWITGYTSAPSENGGSTKTAMGDNLNDVIGYAIAADPRVLPMNSKVYIKGIGYRVVRDTGGAIKGNKIDVLTSSNSESCAITGNYTVYRVN